MFGWSELFNMSDNYNISVYKYIHICIYTIIEELLILIKDSRVFGVLYYIMIEGLAWSSRALAVIY